MLTDAYKASLENERLKQLLLRRENIPVLEEILATETEELKRLQKLKKKGLLDFGETPREEDTRELFTRICAEVDTVLGVANLPLPLHSLCEGLIDISHYSRESDTSHYDHHTRTIHLLKNLRTRLIPTMAHEYTHYVQDMFGLLRGHQCFSEGHALGIERTLAARYRDNEDNEAFLVDALGGDVAGLKSAYRWICQQFYTNFKQKLLTTQTESDAVEKWWSGQVGQPSAYGIGNALFRIYEAQHGKDIYRQAMHGELVFA